MNFIKRIKSREIALQTIYSWKISNNKNIKYKIKEIKLLINDFKNIDIKYFLKLVTGIIKNKKNINKIIKTYTFNKIKYLGKIEKIILSIAIYEFEKNKFIPYKVIINESVKLAKKFSNLNSYKFINSIIDKIYNSKYKEKKYTPKLTN